MFDKGDCDGSLALAGKGSFAPDIAEARARDLMAAPAHSCQMYTDLSVVTKIMHERDRGFIPVVDAFGKVVGVITDGDIGIATAARRLPPSQISAAKAMVTPVHGCGPDASVTEVLATMERFRVRRLPVIDSQGRLQGVISLHDIVRATAETREPAAMRIVSAMAVIGIGYPLAQRF